MTTTKTKVIKTIKYFYKYNGKLDYINEYNENNQLIKNKLLYRRVKLSQIDEYNPINGQTKLFYHSGGKTVCWFMNTTITKNN
ncbi:hypothetical protein [Candidatus Phytoplasma sp. AldY-WA1]|uniref:hypothetical protein n=1 Tax=Candidatus Phytoplasma sp. AldY-WA1 TaxID=2852100 RepID=UPI0025519BAF|nr:hypothetical protein [Candidatus Phytoplasma sp. AldY-WA1]